MIRNYSKNCKGKYGSSEQCTTKLFIEFFAFWDKTEKEEALVLATHGIVKKAGKIPDKEIGKAEKIRLDYFKYKNEENGK
jgi:hypothetical protein